METTENKIFFAKVKESAIIPSKDEENAGYDIYACWENVSASDRILHPHQTKLIPTGIACALPQKYYFQVEERGSTGSKGIKKSAGVVDSGYRGEIFIAITNTNNNYLVFGEKEDYLTEALKELRMLQKIDSENISEDEKNGIEEFLKKVYKDEYDTLSDKVKEDLIKTTLKSLASATAEETLIDNISNAIFYPENKAIAQLVLHEVPNVFIEEISYEELKNIPSKRGVNKLGSSNK